jgi:hypothetical protein
MTIAAAAQPSGTNPQQVKAESVTINMPEGMTKAQADEMLKELKPSIKPLERRQTVGAAAGESDARESQMGAGRLGIRGYPGEVLPRAIEVCLAGCVRFCGCTR